MNWKSSKLWFYVVLGVVVVFAIAWIFTNLNRPANATQVSKTNICHLTDSEKNPYEALQIPTSSWDTHLEHGDFLYDGPLHNGEPSRDGDEWCNDNIPVEPTPTPEVTPTATPTPFDFARDATDKCVNLDGVQATIPAGMFLNDKTQCEDIVKTSTPAVLATATELPATGDNSLWWYLLGGLAVVGLGIGGSVYFNKKSKE